MKTTTKRLVLGVVVCTLTTDATFAEPKTQAASLTAREVLKEVATKLQSLEAVAYDLTVEVNYASEAYHQKAQMKAYLQFDPKVAFGARFQFHSNRETYVYNGSESFYVAHRDKTVRTKTAPQPSELANRYFINSLFALREALPKLLAEQEINISFNSNRVDERDVYTVDLPLQSKVIDSTGKIRDIENDITVVYRFVIEAATMLPIEVTRLDPNGDFMKATFDKLDRSPALPTDESWYYSRFRGDYSIDPARKKLSPVASGSEAPNWSLPIAGSAEVMDLGDFKGRLLLIEFWISHCGHCIAAVEKLNTIRETYPTEQLGVVAINNGDPKYVVARFAENNEPMYTLLEGNTEVMQAYGIDGYPSVALIDEDGKVVFAGRFDAKQTAKIIARRLSGKFDERE